MITKLQTIDSERLDIQTGTRGDTWISLESGYRKDCMGELGAGQEQQDQLGQEKGIGIEGGNKRENDRIEALYGHLGKWKLSKIYEGYPIKSPNEEKKPAGHLL